MAMNFEDFDKEFDVEGLKKDIKEVEKNGGTFKEVPVGTYEIKIVNLEATVSKTNKPMIKGQFKVLEGEYKGSSIFMNQLVDRDFLLDNMTKFLQSLDVFDAEDVYFDGFKNYNELIMDIMEEIDKEKYEYLLKYSENDKGFKQFKILKKYTK